MTIESSRSAYALFSALVSEEQEVLMAAFLSSIHRVISTREIFRGTLDSTYARPREILREALKVNAAGLLIAHNHPSGALEPSEEDLALTTRLQWAADLIGISFLDHLIIVGEGSYFSFADAKLIERGRRQGGSKHGCPRQDSRFPI